MSANDEHTTVMRGVTHGACDFLIKPVRIEELKNIWQHVVRRSRHNATVRRQQRQGQTAVLLLQYGMMMLQGGAATGAVWVFDAWS